MGKKLIAPSIVSLLVAVGAAVAGVTHPFHLLFVFLATLALVTNLIKTMQKAKTGGMTAAGGYLSHVGVGVILLGFLASSSYDMSTKVTLTQGEPAQVGNLELTFQRYIPRQGREKERMEVEVVREDGKRLMVYPKLFVHERTRQVMANPDIRSFPLQDLYVSPIEYDPGMPAGAPKTFELAQGDEHRLGDVTVRFVGFDFTEEARAAMTTGSPITVGAALEIVTPEGTERVMPEYTFTQAGQVMNQPVPVPGGGLVRVGGINAGDGAVRLETAGVGPAGTGALPKLSLDVSRKPLIQLVWFGLYIILFGGLLSTVARFREARVWETHGQAREGQGR